MTNNITGADLLRAWEDYKKTNPEATKRGFAKTLGLTYHTVRFRLARAEKQRAKHLGGSGKHPPIIDQDGDPLPTGDEVKVDTQGNYMNLESGFGRRILTLSDLIEACKIDLSVWEVERHVVNKWEVGAKTAERRLVWKDGQIVEGHIDDPGKLTIEPLIQVKAWLVRKIPVAITPTVQPVELALLPAENLTPKQPSEWPPGWRSALIVPDSQIGFARDLATGALAPFHDRRAMSLVLKVAQTNHFDDIIFLGDLLDLPDWSDKFLRSPEFYFTTQSAIIEAAWWLAQFRLAQPGARLVLIEGNHERRMDTAIITHLAASYQLRPAGEVNLAPVLTVPRLLGLESMGVEWAGGYPDSGVWLNDLLLVTHGNVARAGAGDTAKAMVTNSNHSTIFGHIHRIEKVPMTLTGRQGARSIWALSPGCLCRLDGSVPGHEVGQNWQNGFAVAHYTESGDHFIEDYLIHNGRSFYGRQPYEGEDYTPALAADTGWKFTN